MIKKKAVVPEVLPFPTREGLKKEAIALGFPKVKEIPNYRHSTRRNTIKLGRWNRIGIAPHPNCCGAKILHSIHTEWEDGDAEDVKQATYLIRAAMVAYIGNGSLQYTVAFENQKWIAEALEKCGFYPTQKVINPKTGALLVTYFYDLPNLNEE